MFVIKFLLIKARARTPRNAVVVGLSEFGFDFVVAAVFGPRAAPGCPGQKYFQQQGTSSAEIQAIETVCSSPGKRSIPAGA